MTLNDVSLPNSQELPYREKIKLIESQTFLSHHIDKMRLMIFLSLIEIAVLCGNRVSQMTRAYDDIEAVTRLLEEKEKDLELTVQIGKELLAQNTRLENRVVELEGDIKTANEDLAQLSYDLHTKSTLLAALTNDEDASASEDSEYLPIVNNSFYYLCVQLE